MPGIEPIGDDFTHPNMSFVSAHRRCRRVEKDLMAQLTHKLTDMPLRKQLVNIWIMGHLLKVGPTDKAKSHISTTINTEATDASLISRGVFYDRFFIRAFHKAKTLAEVHEKLQSCPSDHHEKVIHLPQALARDNYRCVLSDTMDRKPYLEYDKLQTQKREGELPLTTQCAHIFSESTYVGTDSDPVKKDYAANAWTIIEDFGFPQIHQELKGENIHHLENILTLEYSLRDHFDDLTLWLEPAIIAIKSAQRKSITFLICVWKLPHFVEFTSTRSDLSLPSKEYLGIHAACYCVAPMSDAVEYLNLLEDDDPFKSKIRSYGSDFGDALAARLYDVSEARLAATVGA
ncbi:hypothetical protein EV421DRAFT_1964733 [Armillaria borealis]|uniref:HNH nuclease domain-containing protein n=1 Tax=Armillaria borealis TaxID=47425 RepID=A0AA39JCL8_9AGAR|nr:hypothetical protein EV421DRAFT_1964733 [Armillaria borealis]